MNKIILILSCLLAVIADMLFVWYAKSLDHPKWSLVCGLIFTNIAAFIWTYSMKIGIESSKAITTYSLSTVAGCSLLGILFFKEEISMINIIGIFIAIIALMLITI